MSKRRRFTRAWRSRKIDELFTRRAERFQEECGWCGRAIRDDEPVYAIGGRSHAGVDLSQVQGKVIEIKLEGAKRSILAGVSAFDSDAKREGKDLVFMVCSEACGRTLEAEIAEDLARGRFLQ